MEKQKIRVGFIGCGWMAGWACVSFDEIKNAVATAVFARNEARMKEFTEKYSIPFYTNKPDEFFLRKNGKGVYMDAVYVASTNETHYAMARKALEAGFPVFLEKPICMSGKQARELNRVAKEKNLLIMEGMWSRFLPAAMIFRKKIRNGEIGKIKRIETAVYCKMSPEKNARVFNMESGGGVLADLGIYPISMIRYITGVNPKTVYNEIEFYKTGVDIGDKVLMTYEESDLLAKNAVAIFSVNTSSTGDSKVYVQGEKGTMILDDCSDSHRIKIQMDGETRIIRADHDRWRFTYQLEHFANLIAEEKKDSFVMPFEESCEIMETMEKILEVGGLIYPDYLTNI